MPDKVPNKQPEIPQPRPDIIFPGNAGSGAGEPQRAPSPRREPDREGA